MRRNHDSKTTARVHLGIVNDKDDDMVDGLYLLEELLLVLLFGDEAIGIQRSALLFG